MLDIVASNSDTDAVVDHIVASFPTVVSRKSARSYLRVADTLGMVMLEGPSVRLTRSGSSFLDTGDRRLVMAALQHRVAGVDELIDLIRRRPRRIGLLSEALRDAGFDWSTQSQLRYRLRWLEECGAVARFGRARPEYRIGATTHSRP